MSFAAACSGFTTDVRCTHLKTSCWTRREIVGFGDRVGPECSLAAKRGRDLSRMAGRITSSLAEAESRPRKCRDSDGIVVVDHGSRRAESNSMLGAFVQMYKQKTGHPIVEPAHMELAEPTIAQAFDRCVEQGADRVILSTYFFFPGKHWDKDIPALAAEAAKRHPHVPYLVTAPIGLHELMVNVLEDRMEHCLSQVDGDVGECEMCAGTGRCKQRVAAGDVNSS